MVKMNVGLLALWGAIPIVFVLLLLVVFRWSAARAMEIGWILATIIGLAVWELKITWWLASVIYGVLQALEIVLIIFGAILLMNYLKRSGILGGFMTGSNTSSNILFSALQYGAAEEIGISKTIIVAMQSTGVGIENLNSVLNVADIAGVVGIIGYEGNILRKTIIPTIIYALLTALTGMLIIYVLSPGVF